MAGRDRPAAGLPVPASVRVVGPCPSAPGPAAPIKKTPQPPGRVVFCANTRTDQEQLGCGAAAERPVGRHRHRGKSGRCARSKALDRTLLVRRYGADARLFRLELTLRCARCGSKAAGRLELHDAPRN